MKISNYEINYKYNNNNEKKKKKKKNILFFNLIKNIFI